jgi:hypothetical protein
MSRWRGSLLAPAWHAKLPPTTTWPWHAELPLLLLLLLLPTRWSSGDSTSHKLFIFLSRWAIYSFYLLFAICYFAIYSCYFATLFTPAICYLLLLFAICYFATLFTPAICYFATLFTPAILLCYLLLLFTTYRRHLPGDEAEEKQDPTIATATATATCHPLLQVESKAGRYHFY